MHTVAQNLLFTLREDFERKVVLVVRSSAAAPSVQAMEEAIGDLARYLRSEHRGWGAVFDLREARGTHDPEVLSAGEKDTSTLSEAFARTVVLVSTFAGLLQVQRLGRESGSPVSVTTHADDAFAYAARLIDELPDPARRRGTAANPS